MVDCVLGEKVLDSIEGPGRGVRNQPQHLQERVLHGEALVRTHPRAANPYQGSHGEVLVAVIQEINPVVAALHCLCTAVPRRPPRIDDLVSPATAPGRSGWYLPQASRSDHNAIAWLPKLVVTVTATVIVIAKAIATVTVTVAAMAIVIVMVAVIFTEVAMRRARHLDLALTVEHPPLEYWRPKLSVRFCEPIDGVGCQHSAPGHP